jgi:hypothetical protein
MRSRTEGKRSRIDNTDEKFQLFSCSADFEQTPFFVQDPDPERRYMFLQRCTKALSQRLATISSHKLPASKGGIACDDVRGLIAPAWSLAAAIRFAARQRRRQHAYLYAWLGDLPDCANPFFEAARRRRRRTNITILPRFVESVRHGGMLLLVKGKTASGVFGS